VAGISTNELEAGWEIVEELGGGGLATEAMSAAIADASERTERLTRVGETSDERQ
jgi:RimJ/RimL family protein N-acetyltransferase